MTFLVILALFSLLSLVAVTAFAYVMPMSRQSQAERSIPLGVSDVAIVTWREAMHRIDDLWHHIMPWVHHATERALSRYLAFRDRMYVRMFGQAAVPRGGATSYFLKRILAHKEEFRKKVEKRVSFHDSSLKESGRDGTISRLLESKNEA